MSNRTQKILQRNDDATWIEGSGLVQRLLQDDHDGSRHQRFVLNLRNGQTLLVVHNIDIAQTVPLGLGDRVYFRGLYEWNNLGGLIHWTHRDPHGEEAGGYLKFAGRAYQ